MTRELQAYVQALTASRDQLRGHLAMLGDTLSSTHDLHRILQVILQTALSATGARAGVVLLLDPADGRLVAQCAEGLTGRWAVPEADLPTLRLPLGDGLLGAVAASGVPRRGLCGAGSAGRRRRAARAARTSRCRSARRRRRWTAGAGDPADRPQPATLGVLALYDRLGADEFDDTDLRHPADLRRAGRRSPCDNVRVHEEAQRLSLTDPLTGLWNYRYLRESLRREVERASRFGRMLSVLALDLDQFKEVNDTYGHAAGDAVLVEFARRIRGEMREVDLAFRQGGEEFVVLLPETDAYGGAIVAERLGAAVRDTRCRSSAPVRGDRRRSIAITITVSIGIAVYPDHGATGAAGAGCRRRRALRGEGGGPGHVPAGRRRRRRADSSVPGDPAGRFDPRCRRPARRAAAAAAGRRPITSRGTSAAARSAADSLAACRTPATTNAHAGPAAGRSRP